MPVRTSWFTMLVRQRMLNLSWPAFAQKGDARMRSAPTWEMQTEPHCWRGKFARSSASDWLSWCPMPELARLRPSEVILWKILIVSAATNVRGPFFLVQQLLPLFGEGPNIVVISSIGARAVVGKPGVDNPSILAYAATKGALETLVKNVGRDSWPEGIRVNAVAPGVYRHRHVEFHKDRGGAGHNA
jgi:hypothetical protein